MSYDNIAQVPLNWKTVEFPHPILDEKLVFARYRRVVSYGKSFPLVQYEIVFIDIVAPWNEAKSAQLFVERKLPSIDSARCGQNDGRQPVDHTVRVHL